VIAPFLPLTPYQIWLAVVVSTGISYASYLLQKFVFPRAGLLLSGFLGGLYSSTVTTFVIERRSRSAGEPLEIAAALVAPSAMNLETAVGPMCSASIAADFVAQAN